MPASWDVGRGGYFMDFDDSIWQGRRKPNVQRENEHRSEYERDFARLVHCASFRRLQGKTQVLGLGDSDFYRTRLTHSMEVAQVGAAIAEHMRTRIRKRQEIFMERNCDKYIRRFVVTGLLPSAHLMSAIGLAHDLGHPPFGHGGEAALNYCMRHHGGFEGNGQTLRILSCLEKYVNGYGLNPTRRLLLGVLKYPVPYSQAVALQDIQYPEVEGLPWLIRKKECKPPKCYLDSEADVVEWIFKGLSVADRHIFSNPPVCNKKISYYKSLDASIMEIADDICYSVHDLEDAISLKLITKKKFFDALDALQEDCDWRKICSHIDASLLNKSQKNGYNITCESVEKTLELLFDQNDAVSKESFGRLIHIFISNCLIHEIPGFESPLIRFNAVLPKPFSELLTLLNKVVVKLVISSATVQQLEFKGQRIVIELFEVITTDPERFLPAEKAEKYREAEAQQHNGGMRIICDYISGMTDEFAAKLYERMFCPHHGSVFDRL